MKKASDLYLKQLSGIVADRWNLLDVIEAQNKIITFFNKIYQRNPSSELYPISNHVDALLVERGRAPDGP
jgi:hypothetical protein